MKKWLLSLLGCLLIYLGGAGPALAGETYAETPLTGASYEQRMNILLAAQSIDGTCLAFGEEFSFNETVGPRTAEAGFYPALNGRGVSVVGGGVAQTATTLYLALMQRDDIGYSSIYTYNENFVGDYVESGYDAVVTDYVNGLDFAFNSYYEGVLSVYMWIEEDMLCCYLVEDGDSFYAESTGDGYAVTPVVGSAALENNVALAAQSVSGWSFGPGEVFSFNDLVGPRSERAGYREAPNGRGVRVRGGGVAQVAATVWLAVRDMDCVMVLERQTYGDAYAGEYVESGEDAVMVDYSAGIDFAFVYTGNGRLAVSTWVDNGLLICEVREE